MKRLHKAQQTSPCAVLQGAAVLCIYWYGPRAIGHVFWKYRGDIYDHFCRAASGQGAIRR